MQESSIAVLRGVQIEAVVAFPSQPYHTPSRQWTLIVQTQSYQHDLGAGRLCREPGEVVTGLTEEQQGLTGRRDFIIIFPYKLKGGIE